MYAGGFAVRPLRGVRGSNAIGMVREALVGLKLEAALGGLARSSVAAACRETALAIGDGHGTRLAADRLRPGILCTCTCKNN